jgi:hypothetical protein
LKWFDWFLLSCSAVLYALPFLFTQHLWWLVFFFPIPFLYLTRTNNLSFIHGYIWGVITFFLHLSGGIYVIACMAGERWWVGVVLGSVVALYQALSAALFFWCATLAARFFQLKSPLVRLCLWTVTLALFITWTDWYSLWIFGIQEGYPLMHPLIPLAQHPQLLLLPIVGKPLLTVLLLLVPASCVVLLWFRNGKTVIFCILACLPWVLCWYKDIPELKKPEWLAHVRTIAYMAHSKATNPIAMIKSAGNEFKKVIEQHPDTTVIIMPESAFNCSGLADKPELLQLWGEQCLGKVVHLIFGSFRQVNNDYYNTAHWVYNGQLQCCFDKRHAMLVSERLSWLGAVSALQDVYFGALPVTAIATNDRVQLSVVDGVACVPYICSELFFNEYPDDAYGNIPVIALVNDTPFMRPGALYIHNLLLLVARLKAIAWQRDIVYVSYARSVFIDRWGMIAEINE